MLKPEKKHFLYIILKKMAKGIWVISDQKNFGYTILSKDRKTDVVSRTDKITKSLER